MIRRCGAQQGYNDQFLLVGAKLSFRDAIKMITCDERYKGGQPYTIREGVEGEGGLWGQTLEGVFSAVSKPNVARLWLVSKPKIGKLAKEGLREHGTSRCSKR